MESHGIVVFSNTELLSKLDPVRFESEDLEKSLNHLAAEFKSSLRVEHLNIEEFRFDKTHIIFCLSAYGLQGLLRDFAHRKAGLAFYASLANGYGDRYYCSFNQDKQFEEYGFSEDSDEHDQDDFDADEYEKRYALSRRKLIEITPPEIYQEYSIVVPQTPESLYEESLDIEEFDWIGQADEKVLEPIVSRLNNDLSKMLELLNSEGNEPVLEFLEEYTNRTPVSDHKIDELLFKFNQDIRALMIRTISNAIESVPQRVKGYTTFGLPYSEGKKFVIEFDAETDRFRFKFR